jgi:hypothetical protein
MDGEEEGHTDMEELGGEMEVAVECCGTYK